MCDRIVEQGQVARSAHEEYGRIMKETNDKPQGAVRLRSNIGEAWFVEESSVARSVQRHGEHDPGVVHFMRKYSERLFPFF